MRVEKARDQPNFTGPGTPQLHMKSDVKSAMVSLAAGLVARAQCNPSTQNWIGGCNDLHMHEIRVTSQHVMAAIIVAVAILNTVKRCPHHHRIILFILCPLVLDAAIGILKVK